MSKLHEWAVEFAGRLERLHERSYENRLVVSRLRAGFDSEQSVAIARFSWLFDGVPENGRGRPLRAALLAARLFSFANGSCGHYPGRNFGRAFRHGLPEFRRHHRERRFVVLLDTRWPALSHALRNAVAPLVADRVAFDWARLVVDLVRWERPDRAVQAEWAREFWAVARTS